MKAPIILNKKDLKAVKENLSFNNKSASPYFPFVLQLGWSNSENRTRVVLHDNGSVEMDLDAVAAFAAAHPVLGDAAKDETFYWSCFARIILAAAGRPVI